MELILLSFLRLVAGLLLILVLAGPDLIGE
jgi:hypothetical protein